MTGKILAERYEVQRQLGKQTGRQTLLARDLQTQKLVVHQTAIPRQRF